MLAGAIPSSAVWSGIRLEYGGYDGEQRSGTFGEEYLFISGTIPSDLTVKLYGNSGSDGSISVKYSWGYYDTAYGATGSALKTALHDIIDGHTQLSYTPGVWDGLKVRSQQYGIKGAGYRTLSP